MNDAISVYGATGFIGSHFCEHSAHRVVPIPREQRKPESADVLFLISTVHNYHVFDEPHRDVDTNLTLLIDVLRAWRALKTPGVFNFISSWFVMGQTPLPATEDGPCNPRGFYSVTKHAAEGLVRSYCDTFGLKYRILRLANVYGPGDRPTAQKNAMQWLVGEMAAGREIKLYNGGRFTRDYIHVSDVVRAIDVCLDRLPPGETVNVGSGTAWSFRATMGCVARLLGYDWASVQDVEPPAFHRVVQAVDFSMDVSKLTRLGFRPQVSLYKGLEELCRIAVGDEV